MTKKEQKKKINFAFIELTSINYAFFKILTTSFRLNSDSLVITIFNKFRQKCYLLIQLKQETIVS